MSMIEAVRECGWPAYLCLLLGGFASLSAVAALVMLGSRDRRRAWQVALAPVLAALLGFGVGSLGVQLGRKAVEEALKTAPSHIDAEMAKELRAKGYAEAAQCQVIAEKTSSVPLFLGLLALGVGLLIRKQA